MAALKSKIRGANYVPSYARNSLEIWAKYDPEVVERELGYAAELGLDGVRTFIHSEPFLERPDDAVGAVKDFTRCCAEKKLAFMPVLLDGCHIMSGSRLLWPGNPPPDKAGEEGWPELEKYINLILPVLRDSESVAVYDVINEPRVGARPDFDKLTRHFSALVKDLDPDRPVTIGAINRGEMNSVMDVVDVASVHSYMSSDVLLHEELRTCHRETEAAGKELILSEWGNAVYHIPMAVTDEQQLRYYERALPVVMQSGAGWFLWELMVGNSPFACCGLLYPNGYKRPAAWLIQAALRPELRREIRYPYPVVFSGLGGDRKADEG